MRSSKIISICISAYYLAYYKGVILIMILLSYWPKVSVMFLWIVIYYSTFYMTVQYENSDNVSIRVYLFISNSNILTSKS